MQKFREADFLYVDESLILIYQYRQIWQKVAGLQLAAANTPVNTGQRMRVISSLYYMGISKNFGYNARCSLYFINSMIVYDRAFEFYLRWLSLFQGSRHTPALSWYRTPISSLFSRQSWRCVFDVTILRNCRIANANKIKYIISHLHRAIY